MDDFIPRFLGAIRFLGFWFLILLVVPFSITCILSNNFLLFTTYHSLFDTRNSDCNNYISQFQQNVLKKLNIKIKLTLQTLYTKYKSSVCIKGTVQQE